jgi:hypothetical protein
MRIPSLIVLLLSFLGTSPADAGPIIGQPGEEQSPKPPASPLESRDEPRHPWETDGPLFSSVFDADGMPMLQVSAPTYLHLGARRKLRFQDFGFNNPGGDNFPGNGPGDPGENPGNDDDKGDGGDGQPPPDPPGNDNPPSRSVPEPAMLLMLVPAAALAIRRSRRAR